MKELFEKMSNKKFEVNESDIKYTFLTVNEKYIGLKYSGKYGWHEKYIPFTSIIEIIVNKSNVVQIKTIHKFNEEEFLENLHEKIDSLLEEYL